MALTTNDARAAGIFPADEVPTLDIYLDARLSRSGRVSNEFALNLVAQHVLGLPAHKS